MSDLHNTKLAPLLVTDLVVAVGSVDGILTTAALLRLIENKRIEVCFTQAFTVNRLPMAEWSGRQIVFVDLGVNNRDPEMTVAFVDALQKNDNTLVAVIDEHSREDWEVVLSNFNGLTIEPMSQNAGDDAPVSSGEVLRRALVVENIEIDEHTSELLAAADAADRGDFSSRFGKMTNEAVKSSIHDDTRRVHIVHHLVESREPSSEMRDWMKEYEIILDNHKEILETADDLGDGIFRTSAIGKAVDMTSLMFAFYRQGARVVVIEGEFYVPAEKRKRVLVGFGTNDKSLDLLTAVKKAELDFIGGFAQKVNMESHHADQATEAIRAIL